MKLYVRHKFSTPRTGYFQPLINQADASPKFAHPVHSPSRSLHSSPGDHSSLLCAMVQNQPGPSAPASIAELVARLPADDEYASRLRDFELRLHGWQTVFAALPEDRSGVAPPTLPMVPHRGLPPDLKVLRRSVRDGVLLAYSGLVDQPHDRWKSWRDAYKAHKKQRTSAPHPLMQLEKWQAAWPQWELAFTTAV